MQGMYMVTDPRSTFGTVELELDLRSKASASISLVKLGGSVLVTYMLASARATWKGHWMLNVIDPPLMPFLSRGRER